MADSPSGSLDWNSLLGSANTLVSSATSLLGSSLKNKGAEIQANYEKDLAALKIKYQADHLAYQAAKDKLDAQAKADAADVNAQARKQNLLVIGALVAFIAVLVTVVLLLRRPSRPR